MGRAALATRALAAYGPASLEGVDRDPRCWHCGKLLLRGTVLRPWQAACQECQAVTVAQPAPGLMVLIADGGCAGRPQRLDQAVPEFVGQLCLDIIRLHMLTGAAGPLQRYVDGLLGAPD